MLSYLLLNFSIVIRTNYKKTFEPHLDLQAWYGNITGQSGGRVCTNVGYPAALKLG